MYRTLTVSSALLLSLLMGHSAAAQHVINPYYDQGVFAFEDGNYLAAETAFRKALESDPGNPSANHFLGKTHLKTEQYQKARPYLEKAWQADPDLPGLAFDRAFLYYKLAEYVRAAELFQTVLEEEPSRVMASFYCGVSLYRERQYQQANPYFLVAAQQSPDLKVRAYYFSGLCHYHMDQQDQAKARMTFVKSNTDSEAVRANADRWLQAIRAAEQPAKPYKLEVRVAYGYDDNVPLEPTDQDDLYSEETDTLIFAYAGGEYDFVDRDNFTLGAGVSRYQTWHTELDAFNYNETAGKLYTSYNRAPFRFGLTAAPSLYQLDDEDFLLKTEVVPTISYAAGRHFTVWFTYTFADKDFRQSDYDDRDGVNQEVFLDGVYELKDGRGFFLIGAGYEDNTADQEAYDYSRLKFRAGGAFEMPAGFKLNFLGNYWARTFKEADPIEDTEREDTRYQITVSLTREFFYDWLEITAEFGHTQNDSNIDDYAYDRNEALLGFVATF